MSVTPELATLSAFSPESRVWVYVCNRPLQAEEATAAQEQVNRFCRQWAAHNQALKAAGEIFQQQFLMLMVDESGTGASGCSIDSSVHFIENLGKSLQVDFFERMRFGWVNAQGLLRMADAAGLAEAVRQHEITADTLMVNTLVQTKAELAEKWLVPFSQSWHRRLVPAETTTA